VYRRVQALHARDAVKILSERRRARLLGDRSSMVTRIGARATLRRCATAQQCYEMSGLAPLIPNAAFPRGNRQRNSTLLHEL